MALARRVLAAHGQINKLRTGPAAAEPDRVVDELVARVDRFGPLAKQAVSSHFRSGPSNVPARGRRRTPTQGETVLKTWIRLATASLGLSLILGSPAVSADAEAPAPVTNFPVNRVHSVHAALGISHLFPSAEQRQAAGGTATTRNQERLSRLLTRLGADDAGTYPPGFAGAVQNPFTYTLHIWWRGAPPAGLHEMKRTVDPAIELKVRSATYDRNFLLRVIERSRHLMDNVDLAFPKADGSGIVVTHSPGNFVDGEYISHATRLPVTVAEDHLAFNAAGGRQTDMDPHYGGAMMIRPYGGVICSTGFSVLAGIEGRLLSAAHCDLTGNNEWNNGSGAQLTPGGSYVSVVNNVDSMLINPNGGTRGYIYVGGYGSSARRAVAGTAANFEGEFVATGGANSGEHRGLIIIKDAYPGNCNGSSCTLVVAEGNPGETVVVGGDSGGPVYHVRSSDGRVDAKGIILQGAEQLGQSQCAPMKYAGNACYNRVRYHPIRPLLNSV